MVSNNPSTISITEVSPAEENETCREEEIGGRCGNGWKCRFPGCPAMFIDRKGMLAHEQVHAGRRIFVCSHVDCGYKALIKEAIVKHINEKHGASGEPWKGRTFNLSKTQ